MCITRICVHVNCNGKKETVSSASLCVSSRLGEPCPNNISVHYEPNSVPHGYLFEPPPSRISPSASGNPRHRSADGNDSPRDGRVRSGRQVHGQKAESSRRDGDHGRDHASNHTRNHTRDHSERSIPVDNLSASSRPPRTIDHLSSSANTSDCVTDSSSRRSSSCRSSSQGSSSCGSSSRQPMIADERSHHDGLHIRIKFAGRHGQMKHTRQSSSSSVSPDSRQPYRQPYCETVPEQDEGLQKHRSAPEKAQKNAQPEKHNLSRHPAKRQAKIAK
ncbi:hypothetical protein E4U54_000369 [Claviceps lovelessii]|nr:hypothetical protein E4U54_000369 [Claviceps lovelessii]